MCLTRSIHAVIGDLLARLGDSSVIGLRQTPHRVLGGRVKNMCVELDGFGIDLTDPIANDRLGSSIAQCIGNKTVAERVQFPRQPEFL